MDTLVTYREAIERVLTDCARIPYAYGEIHAETVFDRAADRYLVVNVGWQNGRRVHGALIHVDIVESRVWVQRDGTEDGIANDLVAAGIAKSDIVLGFQPAELRQHTDFAVD